jgi:hypothetical protein
MSTNVRKRNSAPCDEEVSPRKLRRGKERRVYSEDLTDKEATGYIDGETSFDLSSECQALMAYRVSIRPRWYRQAGHLLCGWPPLKQM